jgi:hypothetical protein
MDDQQATVPNPTAPPEVLMSDPSALVALAKEPGIVVPADVKTAMYRPLIRWDKGMNDSNSTPAARAQYGKKLANAGYSTDFSTTYDEPNGKYTSIIPQVFNGKVHSEQESIEHFKASQTPQKPQGEHFGKFNQTIEKATNYKASDAYANKFHERTQYLNGKRFED